MNPRYCVGGLSVVFHMHHCVLWPFVVWMTSYPHNSKNYALQNLYGQWARYLAVLLKLL